MFKVGDRVRCTNSIWNRYGIGTVIEMWNPYTATVNFDTFQHKYGAMIIVEDLQPVDDFAEWVKEIRAEQC